MANIDKWVVTKDVNTRTRGSDKDGRGGGETRFIGREDTSGGEFYRYFIEFNDNFGPMAGGNILAARLFFTTRESVFEIGSGAALIVHRCEKEWDNDSSGTWHSSGYRNPSCDSSKSWKSRTIPTSTNQPFWIDITTYLVHIAPSNVDVQVGTGFERGLGHANRGLRIRTPDESKASQHVEIWSDDGDVDADKRPYVEVEWEPKNTKPDATWGQPLGASAAGQRFTGTYFDSQGQIIKSAQARVWRLGDSANSGDDPDSRHDTGIINKEGSWPDDQYDLPAPPAGKLPKKTSGGDLIVYKGTVRVWDSANAASSWTPLSSGHFTIESSIPVVNVTGIGTQVTLENTDFLAPWTFDPTATRISSYRVQFTTESDSGVWATPIWDHLFVPNSDEVKYSRAKFRYGGPTLVAGTYAWRVMVTDGLGETSIWSEDGFGLSQGATVPDSPDYSTVYGRSGITTRLVMRAVDPANDRRPGVVVAIIEDMGMLAVSANATTAGQMSFSLPNRHPQVSTMEPMRTHWSLQQYRGSQWTELVAGLLTDFDANENDTIFSGLDYLGVLSLSIEAQGQPENAPEAAWAKNGAKYDNKSISFCIGDQLQRAIDSAHSPVGFFIIPSGAIDSMIEKVTIHAAYANRLDFIRGLLDSHRGGATGRRVRITAAKNPTNSLYEFTVRSNAGRDRPNIKLSYGSIVQAYRVMALGDWADRVYGVGRLRNQLKPHYITMDGGDDMVEDWGLVGKAAVWQDISDLTDLTRKARAMALEMSRAGKRVALGLRVGGLLPLDGWNICDNVLIDIEDGTVSTKRYGTLGWWTIWGWEWRLYPDGHDELTLVTKPREDVSAPVMDLIPSNPVHIQPEWSIGHGKPPGVP